MHRDTLLVRSLRVAPNGRYRPAELDGVPVPTVVRLPLTFRF